MGGTALQWKVDSFLSRVLQRRIFSLNVPSVLADADLEQLQGWLRSGEADFVDVKTDVAATRVHEQLRDTGFVIVDELVSFEKAIEKNEPKVAKGFRVRWAEASDETAVVALAGRAFRCSRWHNDPLFSSEQADAVKAAWARNFWLGKRGDGMAVVTTENQMVGFLMVIVKADVLVVDLIAVDEEHRGKGLGTVLVQWVQAHWKKAKKIRLGTQQRNTAALALYTSLDFKEIGRQYVWHWHATGSLQ